MTSQGKCAIHFSTGSGTEPGATWSSDNTPVATVNTTGLISAVTVGSADIKATYTDDQPRWSVAEKTCNDNYVTFWSTCPTNDMPVIDSISPSRGLIGATTSSVTIKGKGFTGGHINTPATIQVSNITTATDTQITFDAVISSTATRGNNAGAISVTASGQTSNAEDFYVQVPTTLSIVSNTDNQGSEFHCNLALCGAGCGNSRSFMYQVNDQDSPAQPINAAGLAVWDSFGKTSPDPLQIDSCGGYATTCTSAGNTNGGPCGVTTNPSGQFQEGAVGACSTVCLSNGSCVPGGPSNVTQTWHIASYTINQSIAIYCQKTLVNGQ